MYIREIKPYIYNMQEITATYLRQHLFDCLARIAKGETLSIKWKGQEVGRLVPVKAKDWREGMEHPVLLVPPEIAFLPMEDVWEDYL